MKNDKPYGPPPGVALATVAAALTIGIGVTIGALASHSSEASSEQSLGAVEAAPPPASPAGDDPVAIEAQPPPAAQEAEVRGARRHDRHERTHERREHARAEDADDDD